MKKTRGQKSRATVPLKTLKATKALYLASDYKKKIRGAELLWANISLAPQPVLKKAQET
jgi:hypothetical protein